MKLQPGEFPVYKKLGAAQFKPMPPRQNDAGYIQKSGAILVECASGVKGTSDPIQYDWANKISFAIGVADICIIFDNPDTPKKLTHDQNGTVKTLEFVPGEGAYAGTYMMKAFMKRPDGTITSVMVPFSAGEYMVLMRMLLTMAPHLVGWLD